MKKIFLLLLAIFLTCNSKAQVRISGKNQNLGKNTQEAENSTMDICNDCCEGDDCPGGGGGGARPNPPVISSLKNHVCSAQNNSKYLTL